MHLCKSYVAFEWLSAQAKLIDYFIYSLWHMFGRDWPPDCGVVLQHDSKLENCLRRIRQNFNCASCSLNQLTGDCHCSTAVPLPQLCGSVQLCTKATLFALQERFVAVESLQTFAQQIVSVLPVYAVCIPSNRQAFLSQLDSHVLTVCECLRKPCYGSV